MRPDASVCARTPIDALELFRSLRSGLRPHTRFVGFAADSIGRYAWTQTAIAVDLVSAIPQNSGMATRTSPVDRVLLHVARTRRLTVEPDDIYYVEATGGETVIRKRRRKTIRDIRPLGEIVAVLEPYHVYRIHDKWAVNLRRVKEIRLQPDGRDWEVAMQPPVNRVLPVSRARLPGLMRRLGG